MLRCTRRLLAVIGWPVADPAPARDPEDWYANLLWFDRRKCLLLTHAATLFTIFEADVTTSGLRATRQLGHRTTVPVSNSKHVTSITARNGCFEVEAALDSSMLQLRSIAI